MVKEGDIIWFYPGQVPVVEGQLGGKLKPAPRIAAKVINVYWQAQPGMKAGEVDIITDIDGARQTVKHIAFFDEHPDDTVYPEGYPGWWTSGVGIDQPIWVE